MKNTGILRYPGGKTRAIKILEEFIPNCCIDGRVVYSPFTGGSSFELYLAHNYPVYVVASDIYYPLINFWKCLKNNREQLCHAIKEIHSEFVLSNPDERKQMFYDWKQALLKNEKQVLLQNENTNDIISAALFYLINRCSFSGTTCSGGYSSSSGEKFTSKTVDKLSNLPPKHFQNIEFSCEDYKSNLKDAMNDSSSIWFLDPPYYIKGSNLYGSTGSTHKNFDHDELYEILKYADELDHEWILCYNDSEYIRSLYKDFPIFEANWTHSIRNKKDAPSGGEIIIISNHLYNHLNGYCPMSKYKL